MRIINKKPLLLALFSAIAVIANAQKLPNVQQISLRAPISIKIDGKTTDWGDQFQAFNHSIDAFYTIANDDNNLYLIVQAKDEAVAKKIIGGGIVLSITPAKNKFEHGAGVGPLITNKGRLGISSAYMQFMEYADSKTKSKQTDSLWSIMNKELTNESKEMVVGGIKGIDNVISVYNNYGIKTALLFDRTGALNFELTIPLKYLNNATNNQPKFFYNLMIRGMSINAKVVKSKTGEAATVTDVPIGLTTRKSSDMELLMSNTDFWSEYTLAKK
ncbi:hypothetical protein [Mucilaginibacter sp.]|uniref:hypothetical protein n=1 Tax=Mucilaginibacter sp. TaxID=1882438 RepID=UPI00261FE9D4|nr:hypothetical protein [Mucilaginibacter sp.]MDB5029526.1 hypothetical protein [Mucilaginibacter sp.]